MAHPKLSKLELQIMETLWKAGECSIREIQGGISRIEEAGFRHHGTDNGVPATGRKRGGSDRQANWQCQHLRCRDLARRRGAETLDDLLALFGGRTKPVMAQLVESGKLTLEDVREAEQEILKLARAKAPAK